MTIGSPSALRFAHRGRLAAVAILIVGILASRSPQAAQGEVERSSRFRGGTLTAALEELQRRGLRLIFSSAVVRPEMIVAHEPEGSDPRVLLDQILAPLGLQTKPGAHRTILIVPAAPPSPPAAEKPVADPRLVQEIVVTPEPRTVIPENLGSVRSLSRDEVRATPALGSDPSRVVSLLPGIAAADASSAFHARGSETKDVSLVLDGLELYDPFHISSLQNPFSFIDGRIVDSMEFLGGGFTADRGDRHGGFLEISSAPAAGAASTQVELGSLNSRFSYDAPTPFGRLLVTSRYWYPESMGSTITFAADGIRPRFGDLYMKLGLVATPDLAVSGHLLLASDRAGLVGLEGSERLDTSSRSGYLWFKASRSWSPAVSTETIVSGGRIDRARRGFADRGDELVALDEDRDVRFLGVRNDAAWTLDRSHVVRGGLDVQFLDADLAYALDASGATSALALDRSGAAIGAYAAYRASIGRRVTTEAGLRWDGQTYTGDRRWSPRFNLVFRASERSEFRLGAGRFTQSLRIGELRIEDGETAYAPPEISRQLNLEYIQRFSKRWSLRIDAYRHELGQLRPRYENLFDPVELFPEVEPDRVRIDPQSSTLQGVEVSVRGDGGRPLQWSAGYALSRAADVVSGAEVLRSWDQTHAGSFLVAYRWRPGWFMSWSGTVHTGWPTTPVTGRAVSLPDGSIELEPVPGPRNSRRFPTYARLDLMAGRAIATPKGNVRVELTVTNVTNRKNACCVDDIQFDARPDGRIAHTTTFGYWLGIMPSLQVLWTF